MRRDKEAELGNLTPNNVIDAGRRASVTECHGVLHRRDNSGEEGGFR